MNYKNKIVSVFLLLTFTLFGLSCSTQSAHPADKAQTPTDAMKMLYDACKAKDIAKIKMLMSKSSLGLAEFSANQQKQPVDKILENGFLAPTLSSNLQTRDERVKDNNGAVEAYNEKDKMWEDEPFVLEDGGWKVAVGDVFQGTYQSPGKGQAAIEREAANTAPVLGNTVANNPTLTNGNMNAQTMPPVNKALKRPPLSDANQSVEVQKENAPKK